MASGYKSFTAGAILAAADVKDYLMLQSVMVFASAAARNSALSGVLREGLVAYQTDTDQITYYDGTNWQPLAGTAGAEVSNTSFAVATATLSVVTFSVESWDTNAYHTGSSSQLLVPTGYGGKYLITARTAQATGVSALSALLIYKNGTQIAINHIPTGGTGASASAITSLAATEYAECAVFNGHSGSLNWNVQFEIQRLGS